MKALLIILVASISGVVLDPRCYHCQDERWNWWEYDEECGKDGYNNHLHVSEGEMFTSCRTRIYASGYVHRGAIAEWDGSTYCYNTTEYTECYCDSDVLCNTDLCQNCPGLKCYTCSDCPEVDGSTQFSIRPDHHSCTTTLDYITGTIIRGGSAKTQEDDDCVDDGTQLTCFCSGDLCNNLILNH
ncbi:unnamed protein product [Meganyctiphanes norvegica]|uniref:Uncharacterized protein n=1 Tax=Meganyctiphanes norvegica TaxID=48144 RepID=A0AAV2R595_MEGNR